MKDFRELSDRELDALVAERVMGTRALRTASGKGHYLNTPYTSDDNLARLVRDRIAELGMIAKYRHFLATQIWPANTPLDQFKGADEFAFRFEQATPRQQAIAALQALATDQTNQTEDQE
jgi:hypothetical protein